MRRLLFAIIFTAACGIQTPMTPTTGWERKPPTRATCDVVLEQIKSPMPPGDPVQTWVRATYVGDACTNGPTYPYYPAPIWGVDHAYVMMWGGDNFVAYLWPNVPGRFVVTATAPVGKVGTLVIDVQ